MGFPTKHKPSLIPKKTRLQWAKEKHPWTVDDWMKLISSDKICTGQGGDAGTLVWCMSNETYKRLPKDNKHISTIIADMGLASGEVP